MNILEKLEVLRNEAISIIERIIVEKSEVNFPYYFEDSCEDINDGDFVWDELPSFVYFDDYSYTLYKVTRVFKDGSDIYASVVSNDLEYYIPCITDLGYDELINLAKFLEDYAKI